MLPHFVHSRVTDSDVEQKSTLGILRHENIPLISFPTGILKPQDVTAMAQNLFRFLPHEDDPRWHLAAALVKAYENSGLTKKELENALRATYLSELPSFRLGFCQFLGEEATRHLARSINNIAATKGIRRGLKTRK